MIRMAYCAACNKEIKKGENCFVCNDCYNLYCMEDGYMVKDENGEPICMNCRTPLHITNCSYDD